MAELWSLLNFILPDIFDDLETFEQWFDFSDMHDESGSRKIFRKRSGVSQDQATSIITQLHEILKPFLLRRLKSDVEADLPPKKEYLLYAPLTQRQKELYDAIIRGDIRNLLLEGKTGMSMSEIKEVMGGADPFAGSLAASVIGTPTTERGSSVLGGWEDGDGDGTTPAPSSIAGSRAGTPMRRTGSSRKNKKPRTSYALQEGSDSAYFKHIMSDHSGEDSDSKPASAAEIKRQGKEYQIKQARKEIGNMHLENMVMQLRKICCHPYLFDWPREPNTGLQSIDENLIYASGKMLMMNRLLDALFAKGHKVLVFSQFTTMINIIEDWANEYKKLRTCRIDGTTSQEERRAQMTSFNNETGKDACNLFLLSTRAGGLGINLIAADTVIFFDSDWNPQMDLQAQDRVHRIGQTKPVLIFRLVTANTVEQNILKRAGNKRKLEALVIQQGKFKLPAGWDASSIMGGSKGKSKVSSEAEDMAAELLALESEKVVLAGKGDEIISDHELELLLDRSPAAYERHLGWVASDAGTKGDGASPAGKKRGPSRGKAAATRTTFEVSETVQDEANEDIAKLLSGAK